MENFNNLHPSLVQALQTLNITQPTPIQAQSLPFTLQGRDLLGSAQTGTGKTLAFCLPLVTRLLDPDNKQGLAMVLAPTRELAQQVLKTIYDLTGKRSPVRSCLLIGGEPFGKQMAQLRAKPRIIVGTPGRMIDHMERKSISPNLVNFLVLDETDRMFDMGFGIQLKMIIDQLPKDRQTLMFSATMPRNIEDLANQHLRDPERVSIGSSSKPATQIQQEVVKLHENEKYERLTTELAKREGSVIIFVKTKVGADRLARQLTDDDHCAWPIHGDLRQNKREQALRGFRNGKYRILVATDVAARGLDIPHIQHVINYDLPQCPEDYIHRIGRTARAGAEGFALCFVTPGESRKWQLIDQYMHPEKKPARMPRTERSGSSSRKPGGSYDSWGSAPRRGDRERDQDRSSYGRGSYGSGGGHERSSQPKSSKEFFGSKGSGARNDRYGDSGDRNQRFGKPAAANFNDPMARRFAERDRMPSNNFGGSRPGSRFTNNDKRSMRRGS